MYYLIRLYELLFWYILDAKIHKYCTNSNFPPQMEHLQLFPEERMAVHKRCQASGEVPDIRGDFNTPFQLGASSRMAVRHIWITGRQLHWISVCWMP
jgi:hypothetical protein